MKITENELFALLGKKEVQISKLGEQLAAQQAYSVQLQEKIKELDKKSKPKA